jgi:hypothetical protein
VEASFLSLLKELSGHPEYMRLLRLAEEMRPALPEWDRHNDNTNEWKEKSAMRQGFDLCLAIFSPSKK